MSAAARRALQAIARDASSARVKNRRPADLEITIRGGAATEPGEYSHGMATDQDKEFPGNDEPFDEDEE